MNSRSDEILRFPSLTLRRFATEVFRRSGVEDYDAEQAADVLCTADEWGIRSHGLARLRSYHDMFVNNRINAKAHPRIIKDRPSLMLVDGDNGLGLAVGAFATRLAIERAKLMGTAWVSVVNSNHFGIAGYYAMQGLADDLIGVAMTNTPALVAPTGGVGRRLGTNPLAAAFPTAYEPRILIDMATSAISLGSVENARREGTQLPTLSIVNSKGEPSTDPKDLFEGGALLPLGGVRNSGGHKGYCLAALVDLLCGAFPGAAWGPFVPPFLVDAVDSERVVGQGVGHLFGFISIGAFEDPAVVRLRMDDWIQTMRASQTAEGYDQVMIPGDPELHASADSAEHGVPLELSVHNELLALSEKLGIVYG
jgi:L-2-hydroxycarboxylate dehydrogenase (NAD+)